MSSGQPDSRVLFLDRLQANRARHPAKTAIDFVAGQSTARLSYQRLLAGVCEAWEWLVSLGVRPGDRVAACLPKSIAAIQLHLASCRSGAVSLPLNPSYSFSELRYVLQDSRARVVVLPVERARQFRAASSGSAWRGAVASIKLDGFDGSSLDASLPSEIEAFPPDRPALMLYTSGTTGRPKGACITHGSLTANLEMLKAAWHWSSEDTLLHALPLFHLHGLLVALQAALHAGATCIMHSGFDAQRVLEELQSGRCSVFMAVPTIYRRILKAAGAQNVDLSHMRLLTSGSDRLPVDLFEAIEARLGHRVVERYGMTETGIMLSNPLDGDRVPGQVGVPLPGVLMRVVDPETGSICRDGEVGEFQTRGKHVFAGYWRDRAKTRKAFTPDGWFRTGDIGLRDSQGRFELKSRLNDMIITGGLNVYPVEVEQVLAGHPKVEQCAVVGLSDADWGQVVTAFVVSRAPKLQPAQLIRHCRTALASYKVPKRIVLVNSLPRNAMGKVQKQLLADPEASGEPPPDNRP